MNYIVSCVKCGEIRYRTIRGYVVGERDQLTPDKFAPVGDAPPLAPGSVCHVCGGQMMVGKEPTPSDALPTAAEAPTGLHQVVQGAVTTLFQAGPGEDVKEMRELPGGLFLVITTRRILTVNMVQLAQAQ